MEDTVKLDPELLDPDKYDAHQVSEAAEVLLEAEEIKKDPKLMEKVHQHWDEKGKKITSIKQLREISNNFSDLNKEDED